MDKKNAVPRFTLLRRFGKERVGYFAIFFIFFAVQLVLKCPDFGDLNNCSSLQLYPCNYSMGFCSRMLIGSLLRLFYDDYLKSSTIYIFIFVFMLILIVLVSYVLSGAIALTDGDKKYGLITVAFLFASSPTSISYFFISLHYGRMEAYTFLLTVLMLLCLRRRRLLSLIPVLCFAAMATHQIFIALFMPLVGIALMYEIFKHNFAKKYIVLFSVSCGVAILSFIYFQYICRMPAVMSHMLPFSDAQEMADYLQSYTQMTIYPELLFVEYFIPLSRWHDSVLATINEFWRGNFIPALLTFLPLMVFFSAFWIKCIRRAKSKLYKLIFLMCLCTPATLILSCWAASDWDRWFAATALSQFSLIFFFALAGDATVSELLGCLGKVMLRHPPLWAVLCLWSVFVFSNIPFYLYDLIDTVSFGESIHRIMTLT